MATRLTLNGDGELKHQNQAKTAFLLVCQGFEGNYYCGARYFGAVDSIIADGAGKVNTFLTHRNYRVVQCTSAIKVIISNIQTATSPFLWINTPSKRTHYAETLFLNFGVPRIGSPAASTPVEFTFPSASGVVPQVAQFSGMSPAAVAEIRSMDAR